MGSFMTIIAGALIILAAGGIQGMTSFGYALIAMPLLTLIIPFQKVIPIIILTTLIGNIWVAVNEHNYIKIRNIWILLLSGIAGIPLGLYLLVNINVNFLKLFAGIVIVLTSLLNMTGYKYKAKNDKISQVVFGMLSGLLNSSISLMGPPMVLYLNNRGGSKAQFRADFTLFALVLNIITTITLYFKGYMTTEVFRYSFYLLPAYILGLLIGSIAANAVKEALFKKITLIITAVTGMITLISSIS